MFQYFTVLKDDNGNKTDDTMSLQIESCNKCWFFIGQDLSSENFIK